MSISCKHCKRTIQLVDDTWVDPNATGDDSIWRETCDANHEDRVAAHEPSEFLAASSTPRDIEHEGSRFWANDSTGPEYKAFGDQTVGIVDENEGGIVAYVHIDNAPRFIEALRKFTGEI